ncbi:hypothetical protein [Bacillus wiedmannii]|nr:hypothetical protein [Bacillus wiedmannii]MED2187150.1 hypothetical protein [Bacillus wiedmannii]
MPKGFRILACMSNILIGLSYLLAYFIGEIVILTFVFMLSYKTV